MVWMKLSRPCVRIKRPDLCCAPGSTCPRAEKCRTAGLGKQRRRTTQRLSILVECPEVRNSNRSTAARPISSDWYVPLGWFRSTHGIALHMPPQHAASRVASPPAAPSSMWNRPAVSSTVSTASLLSDIYRRG